MSAGAPMEGLLNLVRRREGKAPLAPLNHRTPDEECKRANQGAGHSLCSHCEGTGNELYSMYRACPECGGNGIAVEYGELSPLGRWWAERLERLERKRLARKCRAPRDWRVEIAWRLSRWFGIGQCFHGSEDQCHRCGAPAGDIDYEVRRVRPFRIECLDRGMCDEARAELTAPTQPRGQERDRG